MVVESNGKKGLVTVDARGYQRERSSIASPPTLALFFFLSLNLQSLHRLAGPGIALEYFSYLSNRL